MAVTHSKYSLLILFCLVACFCIEPALANKFETIGGGVSGSNKIKIEFLKLIAYVAGAVFFLGAGLSFFTRNQNAQTVNYTMWKPSTIIFMLLGILCISAAALM